VSSRGVLPRAAVMLLSSLWLSLCACTEIPPPETGRRILGTVSYQGTIHQIMKRPALRVMAIVDFPPSSTPLGYQLIEADEQPDFPASVSYELKGIEPYAYKVLAQLVDLYDPDASTSQLPLGGYKNFCSLLDPAQGWVPVTEAAPATGIDFALYDNAGAEDPCNASTGICPQAGKATLNLLVRSSRPTSTADRLIFALFSTFPSTTPARMRIVPGSDGLFPQTLLDNAVSPGSYSALYVCLDVGGDSGSGLCTSEDAYVLYTPSSAIEFPADRIVNLVIDLDTHVATLEGVDEPAAHACPR
jgi:hypothetical protein